jgi:hypothetical protein
VEPDGGTFRARFQDDASAGRRSYVVISAPDFQGPTGYSRVDRAAAVHDLTSGDYLVVVPRAWVPAVQPLVDHRRAQGHDVVVATTEAVYDAFNGGRPSAWALRRFFRHAYSNWNASFALLVGDGSEDPQRISFESGADFVPTQRIIGPLIASTGSETFQEAIVSDTWLAWCLECVPLSGNRPKFPDLHLGRLPANSFADVQAMVAKLVPYDATAAADDWRRRLLIMSDDAYSGESFFDGSGGSSYCYRNNEEIFRALDEKVRSVVVDSAGLRQLDAEMFDLRYYLPNRPEDLTPCAQFPDTCRCSRPAFESRARVTVTPELMNRLNAGVLWWSFQGHANAYVLSHESFYRSNGATAGSDYDLFANDGKPFLFTAFACHPNAFGAVSENDGGVHRGPSLGEMMLTRPNRRGAIASWGSSGYELLPLGGPQRAQGLRAYQHIHVALARSMFQFPPRDLFLGEAGARVVLGETITQALLWNHTTMASSQYERDVGISYNLLGDPGTRLSIGRPQAVVTANTQPVVSGEVVRLRRGTDDTLRLAADLVSTVRIDSIAVARTDGAGRTTTLPPSAYAVTPPLGDTGPASDGGRRFRLSLVDTLRAGDFTYRLRTVDRDDLAATFDVPFEFSTALIADGQVVGDLDVVSPRAALVLRVLSPRPLDPLQDLSLTLGGVVLAFTPAALPGDTTGREWELAFDRRPYGVGENLLELQATGGTTRIHRFAVNVSGEELRIQSAFAFPNPFEEDLGTVFSFTLESATPADVLIRVFTLSGRLISERRERGLQPGYHQLAWDGRDAEGSHVGNGTYFYRILARNDSRRAVHEGRLVKLRKPRRVEEPTVP